MRLSDASSERPEPGATFRVQCSCGSFVVCHVTSPLPEACSRCKVRLGDGVAARIEKLRPYRGISIPETAAALSVSTKTLRDWEAGRVAIPSDKRPALAALLHAAPELLSERANPVTPLEDSDADVIPSPSRSSAGPGPSAAKSAPSRRSTVAASRSRMFVVELVCLWCARQLGTLESVVWPTAVPVRLKRPRLPAVMITDWRRLRCETCGGAAVTDEVSERVIRNERPIDWDADKPRRGRPPKAVAAASANRGSAA
jgi:transcriptional regulator with XRE-family HTH domain